jgi:hypothetical protein
MTKLSIGCIKLDIADFNDKAILIARSGVKMNIVIIFGLLTNCG